MKYIITLILFCLQIIIAQNSNLNSLIETEYAFSEAACVKGIKQSFLDFIDDNGILFRPGPINGKEFLKNRPPSKGLLSWYPEIAFSSKAGDIGLSTGPWEYRQSENDTAIAFGNFCTIWLRQNDGTWKFAVDYGIDNPKPKVKPAKLTFKKATYTKFSSKIFADSTLLKNFESKVIHKKTFIDLLKPNARLLSNGSMPIDGKENIVNYINNLKADEYEFNSLGGNISSSEDMAYSYGSLKMNIGNKEKNFYYMRVWLKENYQWQIFVEVWNEKPEEKPN